MTESQLAARGRPGLALKFSALLVLLISAELLVVNALIKRLSPDHNEAAILFLFVVFALGTGLLMAAALDWLVTRPLMRLATHVRQFQLTGYQTPIPQRGIDEPRVLAEALETLRCTVLHQQEELREWNRALEERVEARTAELKAAEAQLIQAEKLASIGELAGGVAHEVNNPTGIILARASFLCSVADDEGLDPEVIEDLEVIMHQAQRIKTVTDDLLSFARRAEGRREEVDLAEVSRLTTDLLAHTARKAKVEVRREGGGPCLVLGVRNALEQLVFNLVKNAIEATPEGGRVTVGTTAGEQAVVIVDDTGPGVPPEIRARVFDPFFTTKPIGKGTGLGLAVSYGIVRDHGGTIEVTEAPSGGARFRVTFQPQGGTSP